MGRHLTGFWCYVTTMSTQSMCIDILCMIVKQEHCQVHELKNGCLNEGSISISDSVIQLLLVKYGL